MHRTYPPMKCSELCQHTACHTANHLRASHQNSSGTQCTPHKTGARSIQLPHHSTPHGPLGGNFKGRWPSGIFRGTCHSRCRQNSRHSSTACRSSGSSSSSSSNDSSQVGVVFQVSPRLALLLTATAVPSSWAPAAVMSRLTHHTLRGQAMTHPRQGCQVMGRIAGWKVQDAPSQTLRSQGYGVGCHKHPTAKTPPEAYGTHTLMRPVSALCRHQTACLRRHSHTLVGPCRRSTTMPSLALT
mmetsp:Transcript_18810/g.53142  ORF Transcript_18810/g.53142 Transcript_18810/m.53142 type:complete len:242 (+) Transcript_18810:498-1223(+)